MRIYVSLSRRFNPIGIQLIPEHMRAHLFGEAAAATTTGPIKKRLPDEDAAARLATIKDHLKQFGLASIEPEQISDNHLKDLQLPPLLGANIEEHFDRVGKQYSAPYRLLVERFLTNRYRIPPIPLRWEFAPGTWIQYIPADRNNGIETFKRVPFPPDDALVLDVEVTVNDGGLPAIATALSPTSGWYSWTSGRFDDPTSSEMIPIGRSVDRERLIVGHNVGYDRSYLAEQYDINVDLTRFLDTMSLHVCVCGLTSHQRGVMAVRKSTRTKSIPVSAHSKGSGEWADYSSLNSLADCLAFHCGGETMDKEPRNIFMTGTLNDVRQEFASLMTYCARDVIATTKVLRAVMPQYFSRFPHPVTLAGMLEMSVMYLPLKMDDWRRYIEQAQDIYDDREREVSQALKRLANTACASMDHYSSDIFLWDLDWAVRMPKFKKDPPPKAEKTRKRKGEELAELESEPKKEVELKMEMDSDGRITFTSPLIDEIHKKSQYLYKKQPLMTGFPNWYRDFCDSPLTGGDNWDVGPYKISTGMRAVPKLMRLLWDGFPLHYDRAHGWGYLVPTSRHPAAESIQVIKEGETLTFPLAALHELCGHLVDESSADLWQEVHALGGSGAFVPSETGDDNDKLAQYLESLSPVGNKRRGGKDEEEVPGQVMDLIPGVIFRKLPHKMGFKYNVGNPLSKDFIHKVEDKTLTSQSEAAGWILDLSASLSYWKNAHKRIKDQLVLPEPLGGRFAAIVPRVVVAGTVTRRAVEKTWLTASNIVPDRLGCELKSMISAPAGYHFVGADVDSQELWIASLLGDSLFAREHGCTALGWMTLRGNKTDGTDMHSRTASLVNISRKDAKVLNYARIYGAGVEFVQRFLMQNDHTLDKRVAYEKAKAIFASTKGRRAYVNDPDVPVIRGTAKAAQSKSHWTGGSESHMFNALEQVSSAPAPRTPFLGARMSEALEPKFDRSNMYTTSRLNWVVQSSAVDFLHLLIVSMKYFMEQFEIRGRFSISIHDEVRYLVASDDRYKAALALHLCNLYVRAFFARRLGLPDLPLSIAFFESVEIDRVLRKDVNDDCVTVSNPHGLSLAFGVPFGEAINVRDLLVKRKVRLASPPPPHSATANEAKQRQVNI